MKAPLFDDILTISQDIATASGKDQDADRETAYKLLIKLCASNENSPKDHPLQWEALGDFTLDADQAIDIYQKGIACADKLKLDNSKASILLAMAQRYAEMEEEENVDKMKAQLTTVLESVSNEDLKAEVAEFLAESSK